jgi:hypothetical protein
MKVFKFLAKQNQHNQIARALVSGGFGKPRMRPTESGVLIILNLPHGISKRKVNQYLFEQNIPGAKARKNKFKVYKGSLDQWKIQEKIGIGEPFIFIEKNSSRKKMKKMILRWYHSGCECCGSWLELQEY